MEELNLNSIGSIVPGAAYYLNPTTKKVELTDKTIDYDAVMKKAQEQLEELKRNPVGKNTLTDAEINELAQEYDPQNMTQKEYDNFIRYLEEKGVLSKLETCDIGMSFTRIIPGYNGLTESVLTEGNQWAARINTLTDTKGNALQFAQAKSQWQGVGYSGQIQQGAYSKVLDILDQMNAARGGETSNQNSPATEKSDFWFKRSVNTGASNLTISTLIGDMIRFQLVVDHVKNEYIQTRYNHLQ